VARQTEQLSGGADPRRQLSGDGGLRRVEDRHAAVCAARHVAEQRRLQRHVARQAQRVVIRVQHEQVVVYGAVAGVGGAVEILGIHRRFLWLGLPGYGWDGIIVAILARNNPVSVVLGALFLAYLRTGADIMARMTDVSAEMIAVIQGVMILLVTAQAFLAGWKHRIVVREATRKEATQSGNAA